MGQSREKAGIDGVFERDCGDAVVTEAGQGGSEARGPAGVGKAQHQGLRA